jgi:hypothetical protein
MLNVGFSAAFLPLAMNSSPHARMTTTATVINEILILFDAPM